MSASINKKLLKKKDLSRWNRSGLNRFRYIDGNAVTYLETLRLAMSEVFTDEQGENQWRDLDEAIQAAEKETPKQKQDRWLQQYRSDRRDHGWEIMRSYARSLHILTESIDAYANETYINTATQWNNVRRLVEMLDYHPAPPASAESWLVLLAKENKKGLLEAGFAAKNKPEDGSKAAIFETFNDLEVDEEVNCIRAKDWDKSQTEFILEEGVFHLSEALEGVSIGTLGVLVVERQGVEDIGLSIVVDDINDENLSFSAEAKPDAYPAQVYNHQIRLLLKPSYKQSPQLTGNNTISLATGHGLNNGDVIAWLEGSNWKATRLELVSGNRANCSPIAPAAGELLYLTAYSDKQTYNLDDAHTSSTGPMEMVLLPSNDDGYRINYAAWDEDLNKLSHVHEKSDAGTHLYDYQININRIYYIPSVDHIACVASTVNESNPQGITLNGSPGDLATNDWLLSLNASSSKAALIDSIEENENDFIIEVSRTLSDIDILYANFEFEIRPRDYNINHEPVFLTDAAYRSDKHCFIQLYTQEIPELLAIGRDIIVAGEGDASKLSIIDIDEVNAIIKVEPALTGSGLSEDGSTDYYSRYKTKIYGNVVFCGHGETQNNKILGSGDATKINQQFIFEVENISFISDSEFSSGVRAAIELVIDGRNWKQVSSLNNSDPEDAHYMVRMNEDGALVIIFGDGGHARRLPSGNNNIRIFYRTGAGLNGNVSSYGINKALKPHYLIDAVLQPIAASGGNDLEAVDSLKDNAPASVLSLERAVSLSDFTHLAASNSSVWQAKAFRSIPGISRSDKIEVAIVPANGGALGSLETTLKDYLIEHALPGVSIKIIAYRSIILDLLININIKSDEYNMDVVKEEVRLTLLTRLSLKNCKLGESLYRSQVYEVVESVTGVANCFCSINPYGFKNSTGDVIEPPYVVYGADSAAKRISADGDQLIYMDESLSLLEINTTEFSL